MQLLKKIPFFLFLLPLFFCLHGAVENYGYLHLKEVSWIGLVITICITTLFLVILFFTKNYVYASLICFFIGLWYLFFGAIHDAVKTVSWLSFIQSYVVIVPLIIFLTVAWIIFLKRNKPVQLKLVFYFNILLILYCIFDGWQLVNKYNYSIKVLPVRAVAFDTAKVLHKPNVYLLLFDEYAGYRSLKDSFGFANDSLYDFMRQNEFKELPTFSNYDYSAFSMSSIFNMQYVDSNYDHNVLTQRDVQNRIGEIRNAQVFSVFKSMHYSIENYSIFGIKGHPALSTVNPVFPIHAALLTDKIFHYRVFKDLGWWITGGNIDIPFIREHYIYRDDVFNKKAAQMVMQSAKSKTAGPKLCYAHFLLPHAPYFRDSSGALIHPNRMQDLFNKPLYLSYLKYANTVIRSLVTTLVTNEPDAVIIVMSDHGYYNYDVPAFDAPYNYDNFCLVRFPHKNYLPCKERWSIVNFFPYLFNCEFGQAIPYIKDSSIFVND
jgi:hypothetical protein